MRQEWTHDWAGVPIVVRNWMKGLRTGEELWIAGVLVDANESSIFSPRMSGVLAAPVERGATAHTVEVTVGQANGRFRPRCHIRIDGVLVGGDVGEQLHEWVAPSDAEHTVAHDLLVTGVLRFGLTVGIFSAIPAFTTRQRPLHLILVQVAVTALLAGLTMGWLSRRWRRSSRAQRRAKLAGAARCVIA